MTRVRFVSWAAPAAGAVLVLALAGRVGGSAAQDDLAGRANVAPDSMRPDWRAPRLPPRGLDLYRPVPADNPLTPAAIALGRRLFFDRGLSPDGSIACATCHDPRRAFTDGRRVARGLGGREGRRNVPTLVNRGYGRSFFLDGRAGSLEALALEPIANPRELGSSLSAVEARLGRNQSYVSAFLAAYGRDPNRGDLARALGSYLRTIVSGDAPFDRDMDLQPRALSAAARRGRAVFLEKGNCWLCHTGPTLTDEQFHNTGVAWRSDFTDIGRAGVTGRPEDRSAFKTPTLREVARTAPYMHDGSFAMLEDVVEFYDQGGRRNPNLDPKIRPLGLTPQDKRDLVAFLRALSGRISDGG